MIKFVGDETDTGSYQKTSGRGFERTPTSSNIDGETTHFRARFQKQQLSYTTSWVALVTAGQSHRAQEGQFLDSEGISWVGYLEASESQNSTTLDATIKRIMNENHREMVGAEEPDQATPQLAPVFGWR